MTKKKKIKPKKAEYNFLLKFPTTPFTIQHLMKEYPGIRYITLYKRIEKAIKDKKIVNLGTGLKGKYHKLYSVVQTVTESHALEPALQGMDEG